MKTSPALLAAILLAALPRMSHADARAWRADLASEDVHNEYVRRGDSATLRVAVYLRGREYRPTAAVARYRAGLDSPDWLQAPCAVSSNVVEIAWSPMLAPGADVVPMLVHVDGEVYRVPVMLYVRDSPDGADPGALPVIDFADYSVTNAPWLEAEADPVWRAERDAYATTNWTAAALSGRAPLSAFARANTAQEGVLTGDGDEEMQRASRLPISADRIVPVFPTHDLSVTYRVTITGDVWHPVAPALLYRPGPEVVPPNLLPADAFGSYTNAVAFSGTASATVDWSAAAPVVANTNAAAARPEIAAGLRGRFWVISQLDAPMTLSLGDGSEPLALPAGAARREVSGLTGATAVTLTGAAGRTSLHICPVAVQELFWSWDLSDTVLPSGSLNPFWYRWAQPANPSPFLFCYRQIHIDEATNWTRSVTIAPDGERVEAFHAQPLPSDGSEFLQPLGLYRFGHWAADVGWAPGDGAEISGDILDWRVWYRALSDEEIEALYVAAGGAATNSAAAADLIALARAADARRDAVAEARQYTDEQAEAAADHAEALVASVITNLPPAQDITLGGTNLVGLLPEYIAAPETVRTNVYTGVSRDAELRDGKLVLLYLATQPSGAFSLNLRLADGSWSGAKEVRFWGTSGAGTQINAGSIIHIVYRGGAWYWSDRDTNSDTYDRVRINQEIRAASAIGRNSLCGAATNGMGYVKLAPGVVIDPAQPLLYLNKTSTLAAGSRDSNFYSVMGVGTALLSYHGVAGKQRSPLYLLGELSADGRAFTVGDPAFSYEPEPPCFPLGLFHAATTNSFYFLPGPLISGQTGGDASAVTNLVSDLLAEEVDALPVQSALEVHRLVLADLWDRVGRMAGASDADAIEDILLALDGLDARLTALEGAASVNAVRMSEIAGLLDTQLSGTLQVDSGGVASDRSAGEEALVRGDVAPTSD